MAGSVRFEGFSATETQDLVRAFELMKEGSRRAKTALLGGDLSAFNKWFDSTGTRSHLMKVSTIIKEVDDAIQHRSITFANASGNKVDKEEGGLCGYVWLVQTGSAGDAFSSAAHFGSGMRVMMVMRTHRTLGDLAETMYHELSHKVGGTKDITYKKATCQGNASANPQLAALNAENYNLFLREYLS